MSSRELAKQGTQDLAFSASLERKEDITFECGKEDVASELEPQMQSRAGYALPQATIPIQDKSL